MAMRHFLLMEVLLIGRSKHTENNVTLTGTEYLEGGDEII